MVREKNSLSFLRAIPDDNSHESVEKLSLYKIVNATFEPVGPPRSKLGVYWALRCRIANYLEQLREQRKAGREGKQRASFRQSKKKYE